MKVAVFPDSAMILINQVNKSKHTLLSNYNDLYKEDKEKLSEQGQKYKSEDISKHDTPKNLNVIKGIQYTGTEAPAAVQGRMSILGPIINEAEAAIILHGSKPNHLYNMLNELILFGSNGCNNTISLISHLIREKGIPNLELDYPETRDDIINIISELNSFLNYLTDYENGETDKNYVKRYTLKNNKNKEDYREVNKIIKEFNFNSED